METQNQIKRTLSEPEALEQICILLETNNNLTRSEFADIICDQFNFYDALGNKQRAGCLKALRELEENGYIELPASRHTPGKRSPICLGEPVPEPQGVPDEIGSIENLQLIMVETDDHMRIWNELMIREHPRGSALFVGRQIRYLVRSEHGWLGGFGFSSAALHLEDRDKWIGWDLETKRSNLHYVINMNRFLIRPSISCKNLASHLLGMVIRHLPDDFERRYGYRLFLIESFVDASQVKGTCYRASNWLFIGKTKGRGRQGGQNEQPETIKDIYVYDLEKNFRVQMGLPDDCGLDAIELTSGIDDESWAANEFGGAPLGDKRLSDRLVNVASEKGEKPGSSYSNVVDGDWPKVKGYYRMIDKPDDSAVSMDNILLPHRERTIRRMKSEKIVLAIDDGTDLNYSQLDKCEGLGVIGKNQTNAVSRGLHLHSTFTITTEGLPLGILKAECTAPEPKSKDDKRPHWKIPIEEKKNGSWIRTIQDLENIKTSMPDTSIISVMDREADFFELFDEHRNNCSSIDLIVRANHDRVTTGEDKLFDTVKKSPVKTQVEINVPRQSARPKKSKQKAKPARKKRKAITSVRYEKTELKAPQYYKGKKAIPVWVVHVKEDAPPIEMEPVEWFLLTTREIESVEDALNCLKYYCLRWRIEDWHRVLKSGCGILKLAHETAERLKRVIAISMVIAWRIMLMTLLGRETPELPPDVLFSDLEIKVLTAFAAKKKLPAPDCLGSAVKLVAKLGGYLGRSNDPPPGHQIMWHGYLKLQAMCAGYALRGG